MTYSRSMTMLDASRAAHQVLGINRVSELELINPPTHVHLPKTTKNWAGLEKRRKILRLGEAILLI